MARWFADELRFHFPLVEPDANFPHPALVVRLALVKRCVSERVGGVADHVHLLVSLRSTHCIADVLRELKKSSSEWVHTEIQQPDFAWQVGYAAFTVGPRDRGGVSSYIDRQEEHHRTRSSRDELLEMLALAEIEYDPRYFE